MSNNNITVNEDLFGKISNMVQEPTTLSTISSCSGTSYSNSTTTYAYTTDPYWISRTEPITTTDYVINYNPMNDTWNWQMQMGALKQQNNEKDNEKKMNNEFNFGAYNNQNLRLSPYGMAIKNKEGKWVSYNKDNGQIIDVDIINIGLDCSKIFFKIPKPVSSVNPGDIVLHNNIPVFVEEVKDKRFVVINPYEGTELTILPAISPFGYNYVSVIVSLTEFFGPATEDNPFGNLLPLILSGDNNNNLLLPYLLMSSSDFHDIDPMLLLACGGNNNLPLFLMMQNYDKTIKTQKSSLAEALKNKNKNKKED